MAFLMCGFFELQGGDQNSGAMKWRSTSHEGKFHERAKVPQGREIPMSKISRACARLILPCGKIAGNARHWNHKG